MPDLTPIATEHAQLAAFKAEADALGWTPKQAVAVADTATVDALLDASFAADYHRCACGAMIVTTETRCYPCGQGQRERGPIYGASLGGPSFRPGGPTPTADITVDWQSSGDQAPGAALRAVEAVWLTPATWPEQAEIAAANACHDCAAMAERSEALARTNSDLARQVVALRGHCADLTAQVRAGKGA